MKIVAIVLAVVVVVLFAGSLWMAGFVMTGKRQTLDEAFAWQADHYNVSFYEGLKKVDFLVKGANDYRLHAQELVNPNPSTSYVIISHGYTDNRMGALKYASLYLELGFNCVIYDLRGHGLNDPTFTTYGMLEGQDLSCVVNEVRRRHPELTRLGLHGESLGAATTVSSLKYRPNVDFAVADCAFSDIENVLRGGYRNAGAPQILFELADFGARLRYRYSLKDMRPIDSLTGSSVPVLFIHGANDELITPKNSQNLFQRAEGRKELLLVEGAGHAESIFVDPERYRSTVEEFLDA